MNQPPIDKSEYEKRLARMTSILQGIAGHAEEQAKFRCPYKDAKHQCTAKFSCRYQRQSAGGERLVCSHNDEFDYRNAWESDPREFDELRQSMRSEKERRRDSREGASKVCFDDNQCTAVEGQTIFDHADTLGVQVPTSCGRFGTCHECIVDVSAGSNQLNERTQAESFLRDNYRLACQAIVETDSPAPPGKIEFKLLRRSPRILTARPRTQSAIDPMVTHDGAQVFYDGQPIDRYRGAIFGLAMDVGTTTVVAELVDLDSGESLYVASFENPQRFGGSDVLNRISYDAGPNQGEMHRAIINTLNTEIREFCDELGISRHAIYEILVAGNSTMRDLFFDLDVQSIGTRPYKSDIETEFIDGKRSSTRLEKTARELKIMASSKARVIGVPLIASHVGSDTLADLVAIDMANQNDVVMLVDIGTNTEVVIGNRQRMLAASCPAGPAFEGGLVEYGMPACDGAIEAIHYGEDKQFHWQTIGDADPQGFCGSGLIQLLAELRRHDLMTEKAVFADKAKECSIVEQHGIRFSRADASHLAQAKAANYCGQYALMREFGVGPEGVTKLYLSGGFANYVDPIASMEIGFLAPIANDRIVKIGNGASQGATEMLLSRSKRQSVEELIPRIEHVELETIPDFFDLFVDGCQFKPMDM